MSYEPVGVLVACGAASNQIDAPLWPGNEVVSLVHTTHDYAGERADCVEENFQRRRCDGRSIPYSNKIRSLTRTSVPDSDDWR